MEQVIQKSNAANIGLAAAELILAIQKEFPQVRLVPCGPIEGQDIYLHAFLPIQPEERLDVLDRMIEVERIVLPLLPRPGFYAIGMKNRLAILQISSSSSS